jgi:hypothetical protein
MLWEKRPKQMAQADRLREPAPREKPLLRISLLLAFSGGEDPSAFLELFAQGGERECEGRRRGSFTSL